MAGKRCKRGCECGRHRGRRSALPVSVVASVEKDLTELGKRAPALATGTLAASALELARQMDGENSATSKSMCARALSETMEKLQALAPAKQEADGIDQLAARRSARRRTA